MIQFRLADLRKKKGMTQQELADLLSVSYQTVSRWETGAVLPDVTVLPALSRIFKVSVDALLGLAPLDDDYERSMAGTGEYWEKRLDYMKRVRKTMWNEDYAAFLVERVWKIREPVTILDCGCGYGALGLFLLPFLPAGSSYTGVDLSEKLVTEARELYANTEYKAEFITADVLQLQSARRYDMVICQAVLRHIDHAEHFVEKMVEMLKPGGLLISIECNREFEEDGLYIDGMDYGYLCEHEGHITLWEQEREKQGRDYAVAMKIPVYLRKAGLVNVDCRLNDRVTYLEAGQKDYPEVLSDLRKANGWDRVMSKKELENRISGLMKHGMKRWEAEKFCQQQCDITQHLAKNEKEVSLVKVTGQMITYGWKAATN